uniref:Uncharacterized protein n=1 Tax=Ananas comosus var. bracteatus TaxID=296719 RepID=A0A6V7PSF3_ANACO|nr:unnamed protein product [Ananas comosus var. bracteatus]
MSVRLAPPPLAGVRTPPPEPPNHPLLLPKPITVSRLHNSRFPQHFVCKARMDMFSSAPVFVVSFTSCLGFSRNDIYYAVADEFGVASARGFAAIPSSLLAAEREEAKAVLSLFLRKQGLSNAVAARTINKSDCFIDHLISVLHTKHKSRYLVGRELTTLEIRGALVPYLEALLEEHGDMLVDVVENYPNPLEPKDLFLLLL